jgi:hypothetical protein
MQRQCILPTTLTNNQKKKKKVQKTINRRTTTSAASLTSNTSTATAPFGVPDSVQLRSSIVAHDVNDDAGGASPLDVALFATLHVKQQPTTNDYYYYYYDYYYDCC